MQAIEKISIRRGLSKDPLVYFLVKVSKFASFYLLSKIHKHLDDVPR